MPEAVRRGLIVWLAVCTVLVFAMVLLGGAVRLTGSGLSMVDWNLIMGAIPPLDEAAWHHAFERYKAFPEYQQINRGMALEQFKFIFLMEYAHRLLGRAMGLVFIIPFLVFLYRGHLTIGFRVRLWLLLLLGGAQGGIGWYMVQSGLQDNPSVSQYRLALHLMIAVIIYCLMLRMIVGLLPRWNCHTRFGRDHFGFGVIALILLMIGSGAFVAGTHAGFIYNTFPLMGGRWIPEQAFAMTPWWRNLLDNPVGVQWFHRILALVVFIVVSAYAFMLWRQRQQPRGLALLIFIALGCQLALGLSTLLLRVPVTLGVAHQGGAMVLVGLLVFTVSLRLPVLYRARA